MYYSYFYGRYWRKHRRYSGREWPSKFELQWVSENDFENGEGVVKSHTKSQYKPRKSVTFTVLQLLYVENGAFPFE